MTVFIDEIIVLRDRKTISHNHVVPNATFIHPISDISKVEHRLKFWFLMHCIDAFILQPRAGVKTQMLRTVEIRRRVASMVMRFPCQSLGKFVPRELRHLVHDVVRAPRFFFKGASRPSFHSVSEALAWASSRLRCISSISPRASSSSLSV